jgi:hypothetical protein
MISYTKVNGIPMGNSASRILAILSLAYYEASDIPKFSPYIKLYKRYMDDTLIIWVENDTVQLSGLFQPSVTMR